MWKVWFGLLLIAPACLTAPARAGESIANSADRRPVAARVRNPLARIAHPVPVPRAAEPAPAARLDPPRVIRGAATSPTGLVPILPEDLDSVPLSRVPAHAVPPQPATLAKPVASRPPDRGHLPPPGLFADSEPRTIFAIDRLEDNLGVSLIPVSAPELLPYAPGPADPAVVADDVAMLDPVGQAASGAPPFRLYGSAEYLLWWTKKGNVPPGLVTTSDPTTQDFGRLGQPTTRSLTDEDLDHGTRHGARFRVGYWLNTCKPTAIETSFFYLGKESERFNVVSDSTVQLARGFRNANQNIEFTQLIAQPGLAMGSFSYDAPSSLLGGDVNLRRGVLCRDICGGGVRLDVLGGFRYLRLHEGLYITEQGVDLNRTEAFRIDDRFDTQNSFYGGQLGLVSEWNRGRLSVEGRAAVGLGVTHQLVDIRGQAIFAPAVGPVRTQVGGLYALDTNIGRYTRNRFGVVPEVGLNVGFRITDWLKVTGGYNFLFWSNVVRPGDQIDRNLDVTRIPEFTTMNPDGTFRVIQPDGSAVNVQRLNGVPSVPFRDSTYWAQGLTFGLELRY